MADDGKIRDTILKVLRENHRKLPVAGEPLDVDSLCVVALVDALETSHGITLKPGDVKAESFASVDALVAICRARGA